MKKTKTQEIVYGAMMLAMYGIYLLIDRYSGGLLYVFLYYFLPLPFIVYGIKFGTRMFGVLVFSAGCLGFMLGLLETNFFSMSALVVAYVFSKSILKQWNGTKTMLLVMVTCIGAQILSVTIFASLFGYNLLEETQMVLEMFSEFGLDVYVSISQLKVIVAFSVVLLGLLESFVFSTLTDVVLLRLRLSRIPKFSILQMRLPKLVGILFILCFIVQTQINNDLLLFIQLGLWVAVLAQGMSYCFFLNVTTYHKPILNSLAFLCCFIPVVNYFMTFMGLLDLFSENRKRIMYNVNK